MKQILIIILSFIAYKSMGTAQIPHNLIYKGDTLALYTNILYSYSNQQVLTTKKIFGVKDLFKTSCYDGYVATWKIEDNKLYLVEIANGVDEEGEYSKKYADLKSIFKDRYKNGKVLADWFTGNIMTQQGNVLVYLNDGPVGCISEREVYFKVKQGKILGTTVYDNTKTQVRKFPSDAQALLTYLDSAIDYSKLPKLNHRVIVYVEILESDKNGKITKMKILRGYDEAFNNEAIRVLKKINDWEYLYKHGKPFHRTWTLPVRFYKDSLNE